MKNHNDDCSPVLIFSLLLLAFILQASVTSGVLALFWPQWILLIVMYFALYSPAKVGLFTAWFIGSLQDVLQGILLGVHGFSYVIVVYCLLRLQLYLKLTTILQQILVVSLIIVMSQCMKYIVLLPFHYYGNLIQYLCSSIATIICWPLLILAVKFSNGDFSYVKARY